VNRVPEEELMDLPRNAQAYANADFSEPNSKFAALFAEKFPGFNGHNVIDLGCGPADITLRLASQYPQARVIGVDGADAMLEIARQNILRHASLAKRVDVRKGHIGREKDLAGLGPFCAVASNSLLHHLRDPLDLWRAARTLAAPGAAILVMDLIRPQSVSEAEQIVATYACNEPEVLRSDFFNSLLAAYRPPEIREQLVLAGMEWLHIETVSDRHLIVYGSMRRAGEEVITTPQAAR
jgi:SAM-dependent methyltransferase